MVSQDQEVMETEAAIEQSQREDRDAEEAYRDEQRRVWCLQQAMSVAIAVQRAAPNAETINIMLTAEEMCEFIETGRARTAPASRRKQ